MGVTLKAGRELTKRGGYGVARELRDMRDTPAVCWIGPYSHSYVAVEREPGVFSVYSINGIGEIRWALDPTGRFYEGNQAGDDSALAAVQYFFDGVPV